MSIEWIRFQVGKTYRNGDSFFTCVRRSEKTVTMVEATGKGRKTYRPKFLPGRRCKGEPERWHEAIRTPHLGESSSVCADLEAKDRPEAVEAHARSLMCRAAVAVGCCGHRSSAWVHEGLTNAVAAPYITDGCIWNYLNYAVRALENSASSEETTALREEIRTFLDSGEWAAEKIVA